jgi:hypothetical protein
MKKNVDNLLHNVYLLDIVKLDHVITLKINQYVNRIIVIGILSHKNVKFNYYVLE